jgi:hypothetical protein
MARPDLGWTVQIPVTAIALSAIDSIATWVAEDATVDVIAAQTDVPPEQIREVCDALHQMLTAELGGDV